MTFDAPDLALPEELLLLAHHPTAGRRLCRSRFLQYGVAGAVLAELQLSGHIVEQGGRITVVNPLPPEEPLLAAALATLPPPGKGREDRGPRPRGWVRRSGRRLLGPWLARLEERGALRGEERRFLGVIRYRLYPAGRVDWTTPARQRFEMALRAGFPDQRSRALGALATATGVTSHLVPGFAARHLRRSARRLVREEWPALAVYRNVQRDKSAESSG
ncbi:GOLPH3/VPS74 family protein [Streptomyces varsoviensis]|nr:GPP34 family phosphoprotein [Streptomyces varsoviensis]